MAPPTTRWSVVLDSWGSPSPNTAGPRPQEQAELGQDIDMAEPVGPPPGLLFTKADWCRKGATCLMGSSVSRRRGRCREVAARWSQWHGCQLRPALVEQRETDSVPLATDLLGDSRWALSTARVQS